MLTSVFRNALRLSFEQWRLAHDILAVAIVGLSLLHSWFAGCDLQTWSMRVLWIVLGAAALLTFMWHCFTRPRRLATRPHRVLEVRQESADVWTLRFEVPAGQVPQHLPGQFHFLIFPNSNAIPAAEHHFTISSNPTEQGWVESTIKGSGDFTRQVGEIKPGDTAIIQGSFGRFSYLLHPDESEFVFIAGGIGITPLMSMLRHMRDTGSQRPVTLLYSNKTESDIVFRDELAEMQAAQQPPLCVVHVISRPGDSSPEERGHLDEEKLDRRDACRRSLFVWRPRSWWTIPIPQVSPCIRTLRTVTPPMATPIKPLVEGMPVFVCGKGCTAKAQANPAAMLVKVAELKKAGEGKWHELGDHKH